MTQKIRMKIFSLQSKTYLLAWSVIIGLVLGFIFNNLYSVSLCIDEPAQSSVNVDPNLLEMSANDGNCMEGTRGAGLPFKYPVYSRPQVYTAAEAKQEDNFVKAIMVYNFLFWILATLFMLSVIRYFKHKKINSNVSS